MAIRNWKLDGGFTIEFQGIDFDSALTDWLISNNGALFNFFTDTDLHIPVALDIAALGRDRLMYRLIASDTICHEVSS